MKLLDFFKKKYEKVGENSLKHLVVNIEAHMKENAFEPDEQMVKIMRRAGVKPENQADVYNQIVGLVLGVQAIDQGYERFQYDPERYRKVFLPQKEMVQICGASELDGKDSMVHQTVIKPSRKLIEYVFYKGKGLNITPEVKNEAYYEECNEQNLANFTSACLIVNKLKTFKLGSFEYPVSQLTKTAAMVGLMSQKGFIAEGKKGMSK